MWTAIFWILIFYIALFVFKSWNPKLSERVYEKFGIDIGLFQIKLTFSAKSRWVSNISSIRRFKAWYKFGTILSLILMVPAFTFLVVMKLLYIQS